MEKMVSTPVIFHLSVKITDGLKDFIKKCLEVDEGKRISADGIRELPFVKKLLGDRLGDKSVPLSNAIISTNRGEPKLSLRSIDANKLPRTETTKPLTGVSNKENIPTAISKTVLDRNNTLLIHRINTFRLLYKIHEQIKLNKPE